MDIGWTEKNPSTALQGLKSDVPVLTFIKCFALRGCIFAIIFPIVEIIRNP
jgi:hypothetical protein